MACISQHMQQHACAYNTVLPHACIYTVMTIPAERVHMIRYTEAHNHVLGGPNSLLLQLSSLNTQYLALGSKDGWSS